MTTERLSLQSCRSRLVGLWFAGALVLFLILFGALVGGKYGTQWPRTWKWFVPTVAPSLGLILSSVVAASQSPDEGATVSRLLYRLAQGLSLFYLLLLLFVMLAAYASAATALTLMDSSPIWLGLIQGLVATALGALFSSKQPAR